MSDAVKAVYEALEKLGFQPTSAGADAFKDALARTGYRLTRIQAQEPEAKTYRFVPGGPREGVTNLADDERIRLLACCIADQQRAGFGVLLDLRQIGCPNCGAAGFNTGWGAWQHLCGAEILVDGDVSVACPKPAAEKKR